MIKPVRNFSNFDVFAIVKELDLILLNGSISNVYEVEDLLVLKITTPHGKKNLIIKADSRINLTEYDYPVPKYPSQYIMALRKLLKNKRILGVAQHNFDRIIIIELSNGETEPSKFIIELFNKGNFLVVDENKIIKIAKKYKRFKDRDVLANKEYIFPKSRGINFLNINKENFKELLKYNTNVELVRYLARNVNIAGFYSEEICLRAEIDKNVVGVDLSEDHIEKLFKSLKKLRNELLFGTYEGRIVYDSDGNEISVVPFELKLFKDYEQKTFNSFNTAVDEFYSKIDSKKIIVPTDQKVINKIKSQKKILKDQQEYLEELKIKKQKYYSYGDYIYSNFNILDKILAIILNAKKKGYSWEDIDNTLQKAKIEEEHEIKMFERIIPSTKQMVIKINNDQVYLDLTKSIGENANLIYSKGKKAEKKIKGTLKAIKRTETSIENLKVEKESMEAEVDLLIKKPKKKWYEKFRWFISSDGFLIIGGRDASSNENIFKKYIDSNDLVFHTNFPGSPLVVIKNPKKIEIPKQTINETANFVASYSRAWKEDWGTVEVFYVNPLQVSKRPPSGEFLAKGSFIISGKKDFVKKAKTELAIGLNLIEISSDSQEKDIYYPKLVCGPLSAIQKQTNNYMMIRPSRSTGLTKGKLAQQIKNLLIKNADEKHKKWIKLLPIDEILLYLPSGLSTIKS